MIHRFGEKVRFLREQQQWSQRELADRLGLARRGYISNLETGRKLPSLELVVRVADLFHQPVETLLRDDHDIVSSEHHTFPPRSTTQIGTNLQRLRHARSLTQSDLALALPNVTQSYISHIERGTKGVSLELLLDIATYFQIMTDDLLMPSAQ